MQTRLSPEISEIIAKVPFLPAVTIVIPFNPKMTKKSVLDEFLAHVKKKVNSKVFEEYHDDLAILVLQKLADLFRRLNRATLTESVAIFVSPVFQKVVYLNFPVDTYINVDDTFTIQQAALSKKVHVEYLVVDLTRECTRVYYGNAASIFVVKKNHDRFSADIMAFTRSDLELKSLIDAYRIPVFVIGNQDKLEFFRRHTVNTTHVVRFITEGSVMSLQSLFSVVRIYFTDWSSVYQQFRLNELSAARRGGLLACGLKNVVEAAKHHRPLKLFVAQDYLDEWTAVSSGWTASVGRKYYNRYSYVKNDLDELTEKVLEWGGTVDIIEGETMQAFQRICLIYNKS